ncbi:MAG: alpha-ketoacid dehydrogenase subunit beta, partial [Chloroflexota bacterium]
MPDLTYREALRQALREEMLRDERVFIMGEDVAAYGGTYAVTKGLVDEFGEKRVRDTPIAEAVIVGASVGAAMAGLRPVAELMTVNFSLLALDQIVNHAAKIHFMFGGQATAPMVIRTASGWGQLGPTHSQTFDSYFAYVPGLIVVAPSTPRDAKGLMKAAIRDPNPVVFLEHSLLYSMRGEVPDGDDHVEELGKSRVLRAGRDVTIVSYSRMAMVSLRAAEQLAKEGIEAEIIDLRCLRPMD